MVQYNWIPYHSNRDIRQESYLNYYNLPGSLEALNQLVNARKGLTSFIFYFSRIVQKISILKIISKKQFSKA